MKSIKSFRALLLLAFMLAGAVVILLPGQANGVQAQAATPTTSLTVNADGSISYLVRSGDTLTSIAAQFDATVTELRAWNKIGDDDTVYTNTWLVVRGPYTATPTAQATATPAPQTPTLEPSAPPELPTATPQPTPTATPTPAGFFAGVPGFFSKNLGGLIVGGLFGLALGFFFAQFGRRRR